MTVVTLGIDLAKNVFQLHGVDAHGKTVLRKQVVRDQLPAILANLPPCLIGMETCGGAHHVARLAQARRVAMHASRATASMRVSSEARSRGASPRQARAQDITHHSTLRDSAARVKRPRRGMVGVM